MKLKLRNMILILLLFLLIRPIKGEAKIYSILGFEPPGNVWYSLTGGGRNESMEFMTYDMILEGKKVSAYCIEPSVNITTFEYYAYPNFETSPYGDEINKKMELIGYYGYDYPTHHTLKYRMATQALLWEVSNGVSVTFWTQQWAKGDYIDVSKERNEILDLVSKHELKPSFTSQIQTANIGEELILKDENKVIEQYEILESDLYDAYINENKLYITPKVNGNLHIVLTKKHYDNNTTFIFSSNESQKFAHFRFSNEVKANLNLFVKGKVSIQKIGENYEIDDGDLIYKEKNLEGIEFGLYAKEDIKHGDLIYKKGELIKTGFTDKDGNLTFTNLDIGLYTLKEMKTADGYILDNQDYEVAIKEEGQVVTYKIKNYLKKEKVEVPSTYSHKNYILIPIIIFLIFKGVLFINYVSK